MPRAAPTPCRHPGCQALLHVPGFCVIHLAVSHRDYGRARRAFDTELGFYRSSTWRATRAAFLVAHPLCRACEANGRAVVAIVADHVRPIKNGGARFDWNNLQPLCVSCHNRKTATERAGRR